MLQAAFYAAAFVGWMGYRRGHAWPILVPLYAFVLANAAFAVGVLKSVLGTAPSFFMPTRQLQK
jgi:hypothetical protein